MKECDPGFVENGPVLTTCQFEMKRYSPDSGKQVLHWDTDPTTFKCSSPLTLVIGGMDENYRYEKH